MNDSVQYKWHWCLVSFCGFWWYHLNDTAMCFWSAPISTPHSKLYIDYDILMISSIVQRIQFVTSRPAINYYHSRSVERMALGFSQPWHNDTHVTMSLVCPTKHSRNTRNYQAKQANKCTLNQSHPRLRWHNLRSWRWWCWVGGTWKVCQQGFNRIHNTFSNSSPSSIYAQFPAIAIKWVKQFDGCLSCLSFFSHLNSWSLQEQTSVRLCRRSFVGLSKLVHSHQLFTLPRGRGDSRFIAGHSHRPSLLQHSLENVQAIVVRTSFFRVIRVGF